MSGSAYDPANDAFLSTPAPGAVALRAVIMAHWPCSDVGICRDKHRCPPEGPRSEHCQCRAWDAGFLASLETEAWHLARWLVLYARELGVQSVIYRRQVWGFGVDDWRDYHGPNPHLDHVHIGLTRPAAATLTRQQVEQLLPVADGQEEDVTESQFREWVQEELFPLKTELATLRTRTDATYDIVAALRPTVDELADRLRKAHTGE